MNGLPKAVTLKSEDVRLALEEPLSAIIDAVKATLEQTPPELAADVAQRGLMLAGGGSLLRGIGERLRHETLMPAVLADSALTCVAEGAGRSLDEFRTLDRDGIKRSKSRRGRTRDRSGPGVLTRLG